MTQNHNLNHRWSSASRDARKMYGDITPGDATHQDVTLTYQNYFKNAFRVLPRELRNLEEKFEVWKMVSTIIMVCSYKNYSVCLTLSMYIHLEKF